MNLYVVHLFPEMEPVHTLRPATRNLHDSDAILPRIHYKYLYLHYIKCVLIYRQFFFEDRESEIWFKAFVRTRSTQHRDIARKYVGPLSFGIQKIELISQIRNPNLGFRRF